MKIVIKLSKQKHLHPNGFTGELLSNIWDENDENSVQSVPKNRSLFFLCEAGITLIPKPDIHYPNTKTKDF